MNFGPRLARNELGIDRVIPEFQPMSIRFSTYAAKRLQQIEQANIVAARTLQNRELVDRYGRVDGAADRRVTLANRMARILVLSSQFSVLSGKRRAENRELGTENCSLLL